MMTRSAGVPAFRFERCLLHRWPGKRVRLRCWISISAASFVGMALAAGCAKPEPKYESLADENQVCISAEDLGVDPAAIATMGRTALSAEASVARFPTGVSVVRVAAMMDEKTARRYLHVADRSEHSAVFWNHLWDDLPPIREVTTLRTLGLDPRGISCEDLLRESVRINCNLCILYARVDDTDADAEFVAVLWDAESRNPLAAFRAPAALPEDVREASAQSSGRGRWGEEAEFRAEADLRRLIRDAMWDLVNVDKATPTTQPSPWRKYLPVFPRDYDRFRQIERSIDRSRE